MPKARHVKILEDQRSELEKMLRSEMVPRRAGEGIELTSPCAQVVTGVRRSGKSVLCRMALKGRPDVAYGYANFDDEKLKGTTAEDLDDILGAVYTVWGDIQVLYLDEIQNVEGWELFANRLLRRGLHLLLTGSNSKMLASELATHLTGRYIATELQPFSFGEYRRWLKRGGAKDTRARAELRRDYERYAEHGGLPETFGMADPCGYVHTLYDAILYRDILRRHRVRSIQGFEDTARVLMESHAREVSLRKLAARLGVKNVHTVQNHLKYMEEAYLVQTLNRWSTHAHGRTELGKVYAVDPGFVTHFTGVPEGDEGRGRRLENIVFLQLRALRNRLGCELYYYRERNHEVDFVLRRHGKAMQLVQVAYDVSEGKTRKRELSALFAAGRELGCDNLLLVTDHEDGEEKEGGQTVRVANVVDWLLEAEEGLERTDFAGQGPEQRSEK